MNMDSAAVFLAGSILYALGITVILIAIIIANNLIHKFWKSFGWSFTPHWFVDTPRYATEEELARVAPHLDDEKKSK